MSYTKLLGIFRYDSAKANILTLTGRGGCHVRQPMIVLFLAAELHFMKQLLLGGDAIKLQYFV